MTHTTCIWAESDSFSYFESVKETKKKLPPEDGLLSSRSHHISCIAVPITYGNSRCFPLISPRSKYLFWGSLGLVAAEPSSLESSRSKGARQGRAILSEASIFPGASTCEVCMVSSSREVIWIRSFFKSPMEKKKTKKLPYIKRSSVKVWWALHWKRKSLHSHFGWDADLLGAAAVSHETSLGPNFIISKNGNYHTTYLLGGAAQEAADGSFEIQFVAGRGGSYL